jgi:RNA polymerase sigma factor (TIGR02999 family)
MHSHLGKRKPHKTDTIRHNCGQRFMQGDSRDITTLLRAWGHGDPTALNEITPLVYDQLRRLAGGYMHKERMGHSLQTTALVHEAYLRLAKAERVAWQDRNHFFAISAQIMRRILVDHARKRSSAKRGGRMEHEEHSTAVRLDELPAIETQRAAELCALDDALTKLGSLDPRRAQVIELRFFGGLNVEETADVLNVSPQTVMRDWKIGRAWLTRELRR